MLMQHPGLDSCIVTEKIVKLSCMIKSLYFTMEPKRRYLVPGYQVTLNSSCPTAAKMCSNTLPYHSWQWRLHPWNCSRPASQLLHTNVTLNCFLSRPEWLFLFCLLNAPFPYYFSFSAYHVSLSVLMARD